MADGRLARLRHRLRREGVGAVLRKAFADHVFRSSTSVVLEADSREVRLGEIRVDPGVALLAMSGDDPVPPLCPWMRHRHADFARMLKEGLLGFFVLRDDVAVGCAWIALSDHHDPRTREHYAVAPGEAYHFSWLLDPAERPRGTALPFVRWVVASLRDRGIRRMYGVVDRANRASYRVLERFGYRESGTLVRHYVVLHRCWTRVSRYEGTLGLYDPRRGRRRA